MVVTSEICSQIFPPSLNVHVHKHDSNTVMISSTVVKKRETFLQCPYIIIVWTLLHSMSKAHKSTRQLFSHANSTIGSFLARGNTE